MKWLSVKSCQINKVNELKTQLLFHSLQQLLVLLTKHSVQENRSLKEGIIFKMLKASLISQNHHLKLAPGDVNTSPENQ